MSLWVIALTADIGNLCPDNKTVLVAGIVEIFAVLIMSKPYCICPKFSNQGSVLAVLLSGQCISLPQPVLMAGNTSEHHGFTV